MSINLTLRWLHDVAADAGAGVAGRQVFAIVLPTRHSLVLARLRSGLHPDTGDYSQITRAEFQCSSG